MNLTNDQQVVADAIIGGKSIALLAPAGVGKSFILKKTLPKLKDVAIVAPTGVAAVNIGMGATTIHRLFGFSTNILQEPKFNGSNGLSASSGRNKILSKIKTLVIDEIGMVRVDLLEAVDARLQRIHKNNKPFGGIQVIATGDFSQLAPVVSGQEKKYFNMVYDSRWAFSSNAFKSLPIYTLKLNMRNDNTTQQKVLNSIRDKDGNVQQALDIIIKHSKPYDPNDERIVLCSYNADADRINIEKLNNNTNPAKKYYSIDKGEKKYLKDVPVDDVVVMKEGLRVMIVANDQGGAYVNGDMGYVQACYDGAVVVKLDRTGKEVVVQPNIWDICEYTFKGGKLSPRPIAERTQIPIKLAYAVSIRKSQGKTLDSACINLGYKTFAENILYVALSRVRDLKNLSFVRYPTIDDVIVDKESSEFMKNLEG